MSFDGFTAFERALHFVLAEEGGYVNDPADPGGETNFGISKRAYPLWDIAGLTREQAAQLYRRDYWDVLSCEQLPPAIALIVFDAGVNQGPLPAARMLQLALGVPVDGVVGPITLSAAMSQGLRILPDLIARRGLRYALTPNVERFGLGWYRRLARCHEEALSL